MFAVRNMCVSGVCPMRLSTCDEGDNFASSRNDMPHQDKVADCESLLGGRIAKGALSADAILPHQCGADEAPRAVGMGQRSNHRGAPHAL